MRSRDGYSTARLTPSGTWLVRFYCDEGKRRARVCKTKTEKDALVMAIRRQESLVYWFPELVSSNDMANRDVNTFAALANKWLDHSAKVREVSESALMNYRAHLNHHILPVLGERFLRNLTVKDVEEVAAIIKCKRPQTRSYKAVRKNRMVNDELFEDDDFLSSTALVRNCVDSSLR